MVDAPKPEFRAGVVRVSRALIERMMDLPPGARVAHVYVPDDPRDPRERDVCVVIVGEGMPEVEPGCLPPFVDLAYKRDESKMIGARLAAVQLRADGALRKTVWPPTPFEEDGGRVG